MNLTILLSCWALPAGERKQARESTRHHTSPGMGRWDSGCGKGVTSILGEGSGMRGKRTPPSPSREGSRSGRWPAGCSVKGRGSGVLIQEPSPSPNSLLSRDEYGSFTLPCWRKLGPRGLQQMEGIRVARMVGSVFTARGTPPTHSLGYLTALYPCPPAGPPASSSTSQQRAHRALWKQEERDRERQIEGREERGPFCPVWLFCRPRAPTATPTPILAQLGQGG